MNFIEKIKQKIVDRKIKNEDLVYPFKKEIFEQLRDVYFNGIPASIYILLHILGYLKNAKANSTYNSAFLLTFAFENMQNYVLVESERIIELRKDGELKELICYLEIIDERTGVPLVYDVNCGFVIEEMIYHYASRLKPSKIVEKKHVQNMEEYKKIKNTAFDDIKADGLSNILQIEKLLNNNPYNPQNNQDYLGLGLYHNYYDQLIEEISIFKNKLGLIPSVDGVSNLGGR